MHAVRQSISEAGLEPRLEWKWQGFCTVLSCSPACLYCLQPNSTKPTKPYSGVYPEMQVVEAVSWHVGFRAKIFLITAAGDAGA